jgi:hypothetical protein
MSTPSLFANLPEERAAALDQRIGELLYSQGRNKFGDTLSPEERGVLRCIRFHRDSSRPITIREIAALTHLSERRIKAAVRALRLSFSVPIGAAKSGPEGGGYFLMLNPRDLAIFLASQTQQVIAEVALLKEFGGSQAALELLGQLQLEMKA